MVRHTLNAAWMLLVIASAWSCTNDCPEAVASFSDDPEGTSQWFLPALGAPEAWQTEPGSPSTIVAVIDNGFDLDHPDLAPQLWTNEDEFENGLDDDGNGYADDVRGWDFLDGDPDASVEDLPELDPLLHAHGTAVAGIVAARNDNGVGVAGSCPGCRLMLLRARDFDEAHNVMLLLTEAIGYAVENGARVISISDGVPPGDIDPDVESEVEAAIEEAVAAGVVVVASAGNDAAGVRWPAALEPVVAVAAVDAQQRPSSWTSFGAEVDVAAPGECIFTTAPEGRYGYFEGTSASAPIVAGLAALLVTAHPDWTVEEIADRMRATAQDVALDARPELEGQMGDGVVDFAAALAE